MIHLEPERLHVQAFYARSKQDEERDRMLYLGLFGTDVTLGDIADALAKEGLWYMVMSSASYAAGQRAFLSAFPRIITEGIVFENVEEFVQYLKAGLYYEDLIAGYQMAREA